MDREVWFSKQNLNIVAGRPSNNKSTFILNNLAVPTAESGMKVIIYSLEDRKDRYAQRYLANKCGIENKRIQHNEVNENETTMLHQHKDTMDELPLDIIEDIGYEIEQIEKDLEQRNPDMVIVDYINKIHTKNANRLETVNDYLRRFSLMSKQKNFCAVVCCQVNREAMGEGNTGKVKPPMLHHIKESGDIEQIADVAMLLHWEYKYSLSASKNQIQVIVAKNKDGDTGVFNCKIEPEYNRITNLTVPGVAIDAFAQEGMI